MNISATLGAVSGVIATGFLYVVTPNLPPIDIKSIEYDPATHVYSLERVVRSREPVYSPFSIIYVDAETERIVEPCQINDYADFGQSEPQRQSWPMAGIVGHDCLEALTSGGQFYIVTTVTPIGQKPDMDRTDVFTIP